MSNYTHDKLFHNNKFISPYIGGIKNNKLDFDKNRFNDQIDILSKSKKNLPDYLRKNKNEIDIENNISDNSNNDKKILNNYPFPADDRFDPYIGYLYKNGLTAENNDVRKVYERDYVLIDCRFRNKLPDIHKDEIIHIQQKDPLKFEPNINKMTILHEGHIFNINDKISITGAKGKSMELLIKYKNEHNEEKKMLEFTEDSNILKINTKHGLSNNYIDGSLTVILSGVKANMNNTFLDNLPINLINKEHKIYLYRDQNNDVDEDTFYIKLDKKYENNGLGFNTEQYKFKLSFQFISGIPLKNINADFPVSIKNVQGFHEIISTAPDSYTIELKQNASCGCVSYGGGSGIQVSRIEIVSEGSISPSSYNISLPKTYHNIVSAKLISSSFPVTQKGFTENNNKIYWQNLDDGDHIYSFAIEPGNYTPDELVDLLHQKFFNTPRINIDKIKDNKFITPYTENQFVQVSINPSSDIVSFKSFKESVLTRAFVDTVPPIPERSGNDPSELNDVNIQIKINHPNHNLNVGDRILIQNAIGYRGINARVINDEHVIKEIVDSNHYLISFPRINLADNRSNTQGGTAIFIYSPNIFRLRFDFPDTMGSNLGFRNAGDVSSITNYDIEVRNDMPYINEIDLDVNGVPQTISNNSLFLAGDDYILMSINELNNVLTVGPVKKIFSTIVLTDIPGKTIYNSFIPSSNIFIEPISELNEITVSFFNPDGSLYDFEGLDHFFTIEIISLRENPLDTGISAKTGRPLDYSMMDNI